MEYDIQGGWVYVLMTSTDYHRYKVGRTGDNPLERVKALRTGDPGLALEAAYFIPTRKLSPSQVEAALHRQLERRILFHDESPSEWFSGSAKWACVCIEMLLEDISGEQVSGMHLLDQDRICKAYEADLESFYGPTSSDTW